MSAVNAVIEVSPRWRLYGTHPRRSDRTQADSPTDLHQIVRDEVRCTSTTVTLRGQGSSSST
ncbi:MAG: hypothetical protein ACT4R6_14045, partial [Gemmatimonadaceae bacterium]